MKKSLRPGGDPTQSLPIILGINTRRTYFQTATLFFKWAEEITDEGLLVNLIDPDIIMTTFEKHYDDAAPGTVNKLLAALEKVHLGCVKLVWTKEPSPIISEMREWVNSFRNDSEVRMPRFGCKPKGADKVVANLKFKNSTYALPAKLAFYCGLQEDEISGLKSGHVDMEQKPLQITGKSGSYCVIPFPEDLLNQLISSKQYLFPPSASW